MRRLQPCSSNFLLASCLGSCLFMSVLSYCKTYGFLSFDVSRDELKQIVTSDLRQLLGAEGEPTFVK